MNEQPAPLARHAAGKASAKASSIPLVALWTAAAALMLAVHAGGVWVARDWRPIEPPPAGDPLPPIEIDLSPPTIPPEVSPQEAIRESQPEPVPDVQTETAQPVEPEPVQTETTQVAPQPVQPEDVQPVTPLMPDPAPPEEVKPEEVQPDTPPAPEPEVVPETPEQDKAEVVVPVVPKVEQRRPEKKPAPRPKVDQRPKVERPQPAPREQHPQQAIAAPPRGQVSASEMKSWQTSVRARIQRATQNRIGTLKGTVNYTLSVSGTGQINSVSTSSANPEAAAKAKALIQGIGSVSPPPGGKGLSQPGVLIFR